MTLRTDNKRDAITVQISSGATGLSTGHDLQGYRVASIEMSTGWTAASLSFQGSPDGSTYYDLYDINGNELVGTTTGNRMVCVDSQFALALGSFQYVKLRSGLTAAIVAQTTTRTLYLHVTPV